jgi:CRISPR-associated protein Csm4
MKNLILEIKPKSGLLSELQSDTILGHFCWRLKEKYGEENLISFISSYHKGNPVFLISDGLLKDNDQIYFPNPFLFNKLEIKDTKKEKIHEFIKRKKDKDSKFISLAQLNEFLDKGYISTSSAGQNTFLNYSKSKIEEQLRVSVQIDRSNFASAENKLFTYNPKYIHQDLNYVMLIKVIDEKLFEKYYCEQLLKDVFKVGFGKKKSSGYGQFEIIGDMKEFNSFKEPDNPNAFMVLGNYLPSEDDQSAPIGYDINTKYGKLGEELSQSENPFKNPIVFLTAGSCFRTDNRKDFYGRVTDDGEVSSANNFVVQFGMPFFVKMKLQN